MKGRRGPPRGRLAPNPEVDVFATKADRLFLVLPPIDQNAGTEDLFPVTSLDGRPLVPGGLRRPTVVSS